MKLEVAKDEHNEILCRFFKGFPLSGSVEVCIDRHPSFFTPYKIQSDSSVTYILLDKKSDQLLGVATFVFYEAAIRGKMYKIALGRDLRIQQSREAVLAWSQYFLPAMDEARRVFQADIFLSAINLNEIKALNAFLRPKPGRRPLPRYQLYRRFNLVSLHGQFPWSHDPVKSIHIRRGSKSSIDSLTNYIIKKSLERDGSPYFNQQAIIDQVQRWQGLNWEDFLIAYDHYGNIIGCCAPWSPLGVQQAIPQKYTIIGHNFRQFLKFASVLGWGRKLTKPVHRLQTETPLQLKYLNFLFADNADIFEALAWNAYHEAEQNEFLVYSQMRSDYHLKKPLTWIGARIPYGIYALVPPGEGPPHIVHPANDRPTYIEPFFV